MLCFFEFVSYELLEFAPLWPGHIGEVKAKHARLSGPVSGTYCFSSGAEQVIGPRSSLTCGTLCEAVLLELKFQFLQTQGHLFPPRNTLTSSVPHFPAANHITGPLNFPHFPAATPSIPSQIPRPTPPPSRPASLTLV